DHRTQPPHDRSPHRVENRNWERARGVENLINRCSHEDFLDRNQLTKKYHLSLTLRLLFAFFGQMADWRDERKVQIHQVNNTADLFLQEFSRRTGLKKRYLCFLDAYEIKSIAKIKRLEEHLKKRMNGSLYYTFGKKGIRWLTGTRARRLHTLLEQSLCRAGEVKGTVAHKGHAVGHAKIIITKADYRKMKIGDILVTQMTRPEYVPVLHKAAAIVTDEGGITCHAAIVSRELGIPCIIGTQIATSVLKDGDRVVVDAEKGIIKKMRQ
ncbi:MAG: PEP-utilizing enzyme, partial [Patescibacteria group bacterium]